MTCCMLELKNNLELVLCSVARQYLAASQIIITLHREHWPVLRTTKLVEIELETDVMGRFAKISQSRRRPLLGPSPGLGWFNEEHSVLKPFLIIIAPVSQFHVFLLWVNAWLA